MYKIAVIGDRESALGFKALGLDTVFADNVAIISSRLIVPAFINVKCTEFSECVG